MPKDKVLVGDDMPNEKEEEIVEEESQVLPEPKEEVKEGKVYAGKFKTTEDLEKSYSELETKLGKQGNELGNVQKQNSVLTNQLEQVQRQPAPKEETPTDFEAQLADITNQVEEGDLSISEGMIKTAQITSQMATTNAVDGVRQAQEQQVVEGSRAQFSEQNPDFFEMQSSGVLEEIKSQLPGFHDDVSAFFAYKEQQTKATFETALEEAKTSGFEAGKAEMAKIADGANNTQKVLQTPGGESAKNIGRSTGPLKGSELKASGLAALQKSRGG